jgi:transcriptional regulator with XRE-family HTH domain
MTPRRVRNTSQPSGSELLGSRLRKARVNRGLSLQDVESLTGGSIKAATLSAYELGDSNIPALRLGQLAEFYDESVDDFLSSTGEALPVQREQEPVTPVGNLVHIDLTLLADAKGPDAKMVAQLVESIQTRRSTKSGRYFAMRNDDLIAASAVIGREVDEVLTSLRSAGILRRPRGRPLGRRK